MRTEPSVSEIITSARSAPAGALGAWAVSGFTALLLWCSFTPCDWGPLGWVALAPLLLVVRIRRPTRRMYLAVSVCSIIGTLATLQWMRLGDPAMYAAWIALSVYVGLYLPVFVALCRVALHRLGLPLSLAVPLVWVGLEYARAHLLTGFSWYYLGHTQYRWIELIQIADLVGAYGVSFLLAAVSASVAGLAPPAVFRELRLLPPCEKGDGDSSDAIAPFRRPTVQVVVSVTLVGAALLYGTARRSGAAFKEGPRIALIQGNFTTSMKHDPDEAGRMFRVHQALTGMAVKHQPDIVVWPETMFRWPLMLNPEGISQEE
ncbi:MAG TPA: apolipoprotein N-acyltransferase, partial [Planctomycetaceae bacterium]|nr:apolipoprotein N-acyltransferase [Planctomycetaceae bacterium]